MQDEFGECLRLRGRRQSSWHRRMAGPLSSDSVMNGACNLVCGVPLPGESACDFDERRACESPGQRVATHTRQPVGTYIRGQFSQFWIGRVAFARHLVARADTAHHAAAHHASMHTLGFCSDPQAMSDTDAQHERKSCDEARSTKPHDEPPIWPFSTVALRNRLSSRAHGDFESAISHPARCAPGHARPIDRPICHRQGRAQIPLWRLSLGASKEFPV